MGIICVNPKVTKNAPLKGATNPEQGLRAEEYLYCVYSSNEPRCPQVTGEHGMLSKIKITRFYCTVLSSHWQMPWFLPFAT